MPATSIIALDVGEKRIGVAIADGVVRLPYPLTTLSNDELFWEQLEQIITKDNVEHVVVGLPRNLSGNETLQTKYTHTFVTQLKSKIDLPISLQDEALTSHKAETELRANKKKYSREDVDSLAATFILEDYLEVHRLGNTE